MTGFARSPLIHGLSFVLLLAIGGTASPSVVTSTDLRGGTITASGLPPGTTCELFMGTRTEGNASVSTQASTCSVVGDTATLTVGDISTRTTASLSGGSLISWGDAQASSHTLIRFTVAEQAALMFSFSGSYETSLFNDLKTPSDPTYTSDPRNWWYKEQGVAGSFLWTSLLNIDPFMGLPSPSAWSFPSQPTGFHSCEDRTRTCSISQNPDWTTDGHYTGIFGGNYALSIGPGRYILSLGGQANSFAYSLMERAVVPEPGSLAVLAGAFLALLSCRPRVRSSGSTAF